MGILLGHSSSDLDVGQGTFEMIWRGHPSRAESKVKERFFRDVAAHSGCSSIIMKKFEKDMMATNSDDLPNVSPLDSVGSCC